MKNLNLTTFKNNAPVVQTTSQLFSIVTLATEAVKLQRKMKKGTIKVINTLSGNKDLGGNLKAGIPEFSIEAGANTRKQFIEILSITITKK